MNGRLNELEKTKYCIPERLKDSLPQENALIF
jgi:hypothetical protein